MDAARAWAAGTLDDRPVRRLRAGGAPDDPLDDPVDDALTDARRFGLDAETIATLDRQRDARQFSGVMRVNLPIVTAFLAVASQWRTMLVASSRGVEHRFLGLDYAGARIALDALAIPVTPPLWAGLALMEQTATAALNGEPAKGWTGR